MSQSAVPPGERCLNPSTSQAPSSPQAASTGMAAPRSGRRAARSAPEPTCWVCAPDEVLSQQMAGSARLRITYVEPESDFWEATWEQDGRVRYAEGTRAEVWAWVQEHPADAYYLFDVESERYVEVGIDRLRRLR